MVFIKFSMHSWLACSLIQLYPFNKANINFADDQCDQSSGNHERSCTSCIFSLSFFSLVSWYCPCHFQNPMTVFVGLLTCVFLQQLAKKSQIPLYSLAILICAEHSFWLMSRSNALSFKEAFPKAWKIWNDAPQKQAILQLDHWEIHGDRKSTDYVEYQKRLVTSILKNRLRMFFRCHRKDNILIINLSPSSATVM